METPDSPFSSIPDAIDDIREGRMVIVIDNPERENEGDLLMAAAAATPALVNFMAGRARGLICAAVPPERCEDLALERLVPHARLPASTTAFAIAVDACNGTASGISAADRARTLRLLADGQSAATDFVRPGHVFPLVACADGVLEREGHTEAAVDLTRLAGFEPAVGVLCEVLNEDGTMARLADLTAFGREHGIRIVTIDDLIEHRRALAATSATAGEAESLAATAD